MSEEYSVGYSEGYQAGWNAAMDATPPAQPAQERNFCSRCGKRTADLTVIHTCTPPQRTWGKPWVDLAPEDRLCAKYMLDAPEGIEVVIDYVTSKLKEKNT